MKASKAWWGLALSAIAGCAAPDMGGDFILWRERTFTLNKRIIGEPWPLYATGIESVYAGLPPATSPNARDRNGITPLFAAAYGDDWTTVGRLLREGADPNARVPSGSRVILSRMRGKGSAEKWDIAGWMPIHVAAYLRREEIARALVEAGAKPDARTPDGRAPLHLVFMNHYTDSGDVSHGAMAEALAGMGADPNAKDGRGMSALDYAAGFPPGFGEPLLAAGARTTLRWAAERGDLEAVQTLLAGGAAVNASDHTGWTALHLAASGGHLEVVKALLARGADPRLKHEHGRTALEEVKAGRQDVADVLRAAESRSRESR